MKKTKLMKKTILLLIIIFTSTLSAQVLTIAEGSSIDVGSEASINISGLELTPNENFSIVGQNSITKASNVITIEGSAQILNSPNESMSKNYMAGVSLSGYTGSVVYNYDDDEMNGVPHTASMYVMDSNSVWTEFKDEDSDDNTISYNFTDSQEIMGVTAGIQTYNVTFSVNTANIEVGENGMYIGGGIIGDAWAYAMSDEDGDGVWTTTLSMGEGTTGNYIFLNSPSNGSDWGTKEVLTGQECADGQFDDRLLQPITGDTTLLHCFGSCETDGTCPEPPATTEVTFNVDMSQYGLADGDTVHVNGEFTGWCGSCGNEMSDEDGDGVYTITFDLEPGSYFWKYTVNAWADQESFSEAIDGCTANNNGNFDRQIVVGDEAQEVTYCWNSCDSACPVNYDCEYTISVTDSYGDGWNGASIELFANGNSIGSFTNTADAAGGEAQTTSFGINEGDVITSGWTSGSWDSETSYSIADSYGNVVTSAEDGLPLDDFTATCIEDVDPTMTASVTVDGSSATFSFEIENFVVGDAGEGVDGHIHWSIFDSSDLENPVVADVMVYSSDDFTLTDLPNGNHTIVFSLVDSNHNPLDPAVESTIEFSTFNGMAACDDTITYTQVANGDYNVSLSSGDDLMAAVTINGTMEVNWDSIIVTDGAGNQLNEQIDGEFVNAIFYSQDGTINVQILNDPSIQNGDVTLAFSCEALSTPENEVSKIRVYPNPSSSIVYIDYIEDLEITLFNVLGQQILKTNSKTIDISSLNEGTYLLVAKDSNNTITNFKIIKK